MRARNRISSLLSCLLLCTAASAAQMNGKLPMYPNGHNMNNMPTSAVAMGVPLVLETDDPVQKVDSWYTSNAPKACARSTASQGIKYVCPGGSIMIYLHGGKTQIAFVPAMPSFMGGR
jgi:hypothetical protein